MTKADYINIKHSIPDLKGRICSIPGGGITTYDPQGNVLSKGFSMRVSGSRMVQPDKSKAPYGEVTVEVTKATTEGGRATYNVTVPTLHFLEHHFDFLRDAVGADVEVNDKDPYDKLLLVTLAASSPDTKHLAPVVTATHWTEPSGWMCEGVLTCNAPVEICREELPNQSGEQVYRLRVPTDRPGFWDYATATIAEINSGTYTFPGRQMSVQNAIKTAHGMLGRYEALSEGERVSQAQAEYTQPQREATEERNRHFGFIGRPAERR